MHYYVLDDENRVVNTIVLEEGTDPAAFGAVADDRVFGIGDTWCPPPDPQADTDALTIDHEYRLTLLELGVI